MGKSSRLKVRMAEKLARLIRGMHPGLKKKVGRSLETILADPASGKALRDDLGGLRSFKVGRLRVVYRVSRTEIQIVAVGPRTSIYEETSRLVKRERGPK